MGDFLVIKLVDSARGNDMQELEFCLSMQVDVNAVNGSGDTALVAAVNEGNLAIVQRLLKEEDLDVNKIGKDKKTPLFIACQKGLINIATPLLAHADIDVNATDKFTTTCLMVAMRSRNDDIIRSLLKHSGLDINKQKKDGTTALMMAVNLAHTKLVLELLRRKDVNIGLKNNKDMTARDIAVKKKAKSIVTAFDNLEKRKASRVSVSRSRLLAGNSKLKQYQAKVSRASSFMGDGIDDFHSKLDGASATTGEEKKQKYSYEKLDEATAMSSVVLRMKATALHKSNTNNHMSSTSNKQIMQETINDDSSSTGKKTKEAETGVEVLDAEEYQTELGKFLVQNGFKDLCAAFFKQNVKQIYVASKMSDFELAHNVGIQSNKTKDQLVKLLKEQADSKAPPKRKHDVCFLSNPEGNVDDLSTKAAEKKVSFVHLKSTKSKPLIEVFDEVENSNCLVCVIQSEDFFKDVNNLAALMWGFTHKIKIVGLNRTKDEAKPDNVLFKLTMRLGNTVLQKEDWEVLEKHNLTYPNAYDALEHLSKNMASSEADLFAKLT